jgi:hypothetical protein
MGIWTTPDNHSLYIIVRDQQNYLLQLPYLVNNLTLTVIAVALPRYNTFSYFAGYGTTLLK